MILYTVRNPYSILAVFLMAMFNSLLVATVFYQSGAQRLILYPVNEDTMAQNNAIQQNWVGVVFYTTRDMFITLSMCQVMQTDNFFRVYVREQSNKMYWPTAYFISGFTISTFTLMFYPVLVGFTSFWFLDFNDSSIENLVEYIVILSITAFNGCAFGYMFTCVVEDSK